MAAGPKKLKYCGYIIGPRPIEGHGLSSDPTDTELVQCCGKLARFRLFVNGDAEYWVCAQHYDLIAPELGENLAETTAEPINATE